MKKKIIALSIAALAIVSISSCGNKVKEISGTQTAETKRAVYYQCKMKCEGDKTYDKPGTCPECKMDLYAIDSAVQDHTAAGIHEQTDSVRK